MSTTPLWAGRSAESGDHDWFSEPAPRYEPPRPPEEPEPPRKRPWRRLAFGGVAVLLVAAGIAVGASLLGGGHEARPAAPLPAALGGRPAESRVNQIYAAVNRGVVQVRTGSGSGTGFVVQGDGTIVTNDHVVGNASQVEVRFNDGDRPVRATVSGTDPSSDLAVLHIDPGAAPQQLHPLGLADSDRVRVGDLAVAIGYPLGLDKTATAGIVSGVGREIQAPNGFSIDKVIQTDAPINPGNSGGPLLDARGRVIGVNSQIATAGGGGGNVGIGFAIPSNTVRSVVPRLKRGEHIRHPYLGVSTAPAPTGQGAMVEQVTPGGPAQHAGLRPGQDVIVSVDGHTVTGPDDVVKALDGRKPGDAVAVVVRRGGARRTITVRLGDRPDRVGP
jgi:putative serine protease PepD